jgi:hypothetical protein
MFWNYYNLLDLGLLKQKVCLIRRLLTRYMSLGPKIGDSPQIKQTLARKLGV